jgi:hypothetical protein
MTIDSNEQPFEGVHYYSAHELGIILSVYAETWSRGSGVYRFGIGKKEWVSEALAKISAVNVKAYEEAHRKHVEPLTAEQISAAMPPKPIAAPQGELREFLKGLRFNLFGFEPTTEQELDEVDAEVRHTATLLWDGDYYTPVYGPTEVP